MKTMHVVVEDYNPNWKIEFEKIKDELMMVLSDKIISIECRKHICRGTSC